MEILPTLKKDEKPKWGGYRAGSGRKPKHQWEVRELLNMEIENRMPQILEKIDELIKQGDPSIIKFLLEQRFGKATNFIDWTYRNGHQVGEVTTNND